MAQHQIRSVGGVNPLSLCSAWSPAKKEASQSKGDTSGMFAKGTSMLKSAKRTKEQAEERSFGEEKMIILEGVKHSFIYRSLHRSRFSGGSDGSYSKWSRWVNTL